MALEEVHTNKKDCNLGCKSCKKVLSGNLNADYSQDESLGTKASLGVFAVTYQAGSKHTQLQLLHFNPK